MWSPKPLRAVASRSPAGGEPPSVYRRFTPPFCASKNPGPRCRVLRLLRPPGARVDRPLYIDPAHHGRGRFEIAPPQVPSRARRPSNNSGMARSPFTYQPTGVATQHRPSCAQDGVPLQGARRQPTRPCAPTLDHVCADRRSAAWEGRSRPRGAPRAHKQAVLDAGQRVQVGQCPGPALGCLRPATVV